MLRFSSLNGRAQKSGRDTRRLVSVRSLKAASLAFALTNFLREGRRESCMHTRTPPSRLFSLHTCRLCLRLRLRLRFSFHTSHESTTATWESKLVAVGAITLGPELHGFDVIARMGTDTFLPPTLRPWLWCPRPRVTRLLAFMQAVSSARRGLGRRTRRATPVSGPPRRGVASFRLSPPGASGQGLPFPIACLGHCS